MNAAARMNWYFDFIARIACLQWRRLRDHPDLASSPEPIPAATRRKSPA